MPTKVKKDGFTYLKKREESPQPKVDLAALEEVLKGTKSKAVNTQYRIDFKPKSWQLKAWRTVGSKVENNYRDNHRAFPEAKSPQMRKVVFMIVRYRILLKRNGRTIQIINIDDNPTFDTVTSGRRGSAGTFQVIDNAESFAEYTNRVYALTKKVNAIMERLPDYDVLCEMKTLYAMKNRTVESYAGYAWDFYHQCEVL